MNSNSNIKPPKFLNLGDGSYHYNFNIQEVEVVDEEGKKSIEYTYQTVHIWEKPNYDALVKAVIRDKYDDTQELSLINKYNSFVLKLSDDPEYESKYKAYLTEIQNVKSMVKEDLQLNNE